MRNRVVVSAGRVRVRPAGEVASNARKRLVVPAVRLKARYIYLYSVITLGTGDSAARSYDLRKTCISSDFPLNGNIACPVCEGA